MSHLYGGHNMYTYKYIYKHIFPSTSCSHNTVAHTSTQYHRVALLQGINIVLEHTVNISNKKLYRETIILSD
jgi:hypothetical protein